MLFVCYCSLCAIPSTTVFWTSRRLMLLEISPIVSVFLSFFMSYNFINIPKISSSWTCYLLGWESLHLDQIRLLFLSKKNPEPFSFFVVIFTKILLLDKSHFEAKLSKRKVVCFLKENMWSEVFSRISTLKVITFH